MEFLYQEVVPMNILLKMIVITLVLLFSIVIGLLFCLGIRDNFTDGHKIKSVILSILLATFTSFIIFLCIQVGNAATIHKYYKINGEVYDVEFGENDKIINVDKIRRD